MTPISFDRASDGDSLRPSIRDVEDHMRNLLFAVASIALLAGSAPALAAPCKDAKGKFTKCPPKAQKPVRCKDAKGKFAKCGTAGAKPM